MTVTVTDHNSGGLVAQFMGLKAFIPFSRLVKQQGVYWDDAAAKHMVGSQVEAAIIECDAAAKRLTLSPRQAAINRAMRGLAVGSLVTGTVAEFSMYGAFVHLEEHMGLRALLHVSKISCEAVHDPKVCWVGRWALERAATAQLHLPASLLTPLSPSKRPRSTGCVPARRACGGHGGGGGGGRPAHRSQHRTP